MSISNVNANAISNVYGSSKQGEKDLKSEKTTKAVQQAKLIHSKSTDDTAVIYESSKNNTTSETDNKTQALYKRDDNTIEKLKAEAEKRTSQLRSLVEKMLLKQGKTFDENTDIYAFLRSGEYTVDEETAKQAQEDISEDGYWGVEKTSDRLISFAKALTGGDPSKVDEMREAIQKGYEEATKSWGDELPSICKDTLDATMKKLDEWAASSKETSVDETSAN